MCTQRSLKGAWLIELGTDIWEVSKKHKLVMTKFEMVSRMEFSRERSMSEDLDLTRKMSIQSLSEEARVPDSPTDSLPAYSDVVNLPIILFPDRRLSIYSQISGFSSSFRKLRGKKFGDVGKIFSGDIFLKFLFFTQI